MAVKNLLIKLGVIGDKDAKKKVKGVESSFKGLARSAVSAGAAFFGARGLIQGLQTSVELFAIQEEAEKKLSTALGRTSTELLNQASALQKVTTFGDEAIISQQAFLASLEFSEDQIKNIITASLDLSAATGISLESAVRNTAKTFSGLSGELGELIPQLRGLTTEQMKAGDAVKVIAELFGGQAQAETQTYAGRVAQLTNEFGDMAEGVGQLVIPVFEKLSPHLKTAIEFWKKYLDVGKETVSQTREYDTEIDSLNEQILYQQSLIQGLGATGMDLNGTTEKHNQLRKRAFDQGRNLVEQRDFELEQINELIQKQNELKEQREQANEIKRLEEEAGERTFEIRKTEINLLEGINTVTAKLTDSSKKLSKEKKKQLEQDLRTAALTGQSAEQSMASVVRAEAMKSVAILISSIFRSMPYPLNLILAAGAGAIASQKIDEGLAEVKKIKLGFAEGGIVPGEGNQDTVPAMLTPGELILNQAQQENLAGNMGVTVNISGNIIGNESFVRDTLIPEIEKARTLA